MNHTSAKAAVRQRIKESRKSMSPDLRAAKNRALCDNVATFLRNHPATRIAAYVPLPTEPGGNLLIDTLHAATTELYLPCSNDDRTLSWGLFTGWDSLKAGAYSIPEPQHSPFDSTVLEELDLIFVPALAINRHGYRLGKGAGFYDRALSGCSTPTATLVFEEEVLEELPYEDHDIPTTFVITDGTDE